MFKRSLMIAVAAVTLYGSALADDLYKVSISSAEQARRLSATGVVPMVRLDDGYLITASAADRSAMDESGLAFTLISRDVDRSKLAIDNRLDRANVSRFPLIFEQGKRHEPHV